MLVRHSSGRLEPRRVRKSVKDFDQRLQNLCSEYRDGARDLMSFLRAVGNSIRLIG